MFTSRRSRPALTAALICSTALVADIGGNVAIAALVNIDVRDHTFQVVSAVPGQGTHQCTINVGDTVRWTWFANFHSVTADNGSYDSGLHNMPFTFDHTFNSTGTFGYHCIAHGGPGFAMFGTITVVTDCPADLNGDNVVNIDDLLSVINAWGPCSCPPDIAPPGGGNGTVNIDDLLAVINSWGTCP